MGGLKVVFSNKWGYELVSLVGCSRRSSLKAINALCGLDSSQPMPQVPWPNKTTGFALGAISSAHLFLGLRVAGSHSFQVFL